MNLINDDCLKAMSALTRVDYSFTSPPYNRKKNDKYANYVDIVEDWFGWNCDVIDRLLAITKEYVFYNIQPNCYNRGDFYKLIGKYSNKIVEIIIWEKSNPMPAPGKAMTNAVEYFIVMNNTGKPLKSKTTYTKNHLTTSVNSAMPKHHKAVMKQEVSDWFFDKFMHKGKVVLDCFMGMGTTGVSAERYGLDFIGIEKDAQYFGDAKNIINAISEKKRQQKRVKEKK